MTALNKHAELRQLSEKATQGEWWSDVVETEGEYGEGEDRASGYHSYAVYVGSESLLDMTNSTAACIHEEWDHDYHMAWDETAKRNAEFIAAANPATVLALLDELEVAKRERDNWRNSFDNERFRADKLAEAFKTEHEQLVMANRALITQHVRANGAEKRIAELEAREVKLPKPISVLHRRDFNDAHREIYAYPEAEVNAALAAAGIGVKGE